MSEKIALHPTGAGRGNVIDADFAPAAADVSSKDFAGVFDFAPRPKIGSPYYWLLRADTADIYYPVGSTTPHKVKLTRSGTEERLIVHFVEMTKANASK